MWLELMGWAFPWLLGYGMGAWLALMLAEPSVFALAEAIRDGTGWDVTKQVARYLAVPLWPVALLVIVACLPAYMLYVVAQASALTAGSVLLIGEAIVERTRRPLPSAPPGALSLTDSQET